MKMEPLQDGCLKIWMTETDMHHWGLHFNRMHAQDEATRRAIIKLITLAQERHILRASHDVVVEALPISDGCLLLLSPAVPLKRIPLPTVYRFTDADALLQFGRALAHESTFPPASLYQWNTEYRLIVYAGWEPLCRYRRLLSEFAQPLTDHAAYTEEHGRALAVGNALQVLTGRGSPSPKRPDPLH